MNVVFTLPPMASLDHRDSFDTADDVRSSKNLLFFLSPILTNRSSKFLKWLRMPHLHSLHSFRVSCSSYLSLILAYRIEGTAIVCLWSVIAVRMKWCCVCVPQFLRLLMQFGGVMVFCSSSDHPRVPNRKRTMIVLCVDWWLRYERNGCACVPWFLQLLTELDSCMVFCSSCGHPRVQNRMQHDFVLLIDDFLCARNGRVCVPGFRQSWMELDSHGVCCSSPDHAHRILLGHRIQSSVLLIGNCRMREELARMRATCSAVADGIRLIYGFCSSFNYPRVQNRKQHEYVHSDW